MADKDDDKDKAEPEPLTEAQRLENLEKKVEQERSERHVYQRRCVDLEKQVAELTNRLLAADHK